MVTTRFGLPADVHVKGHACIQCPIKTAHYASAQEMATDDLPELRCTLHHMPMPRC